MVKINFQQSFVFIIFCAISTTTPINGYRVLGLFPHPGVSHFHFFHPIMRELAAVGHNVTVVSHFPDAKAPPNYVDIPLTGVPILTNTIDLSVSIVVKYFLNL